MNAFEQLNPALQHHIVNSLGWRELRPFQEAVIPPILHGDHAIVLAPTAGGKTEAAFFPVLSRMLTESWTGLNVLYICPIKALLNNLNERLRRYCTLIGRRSELWHGDIKSSVKRKVIIDPPDCLLTTPESLEVMLISRNVDHRAFFSNLQAVIIDEIHAFAGDDRGWHLLSVLARIEKLAGREIQRIGLSATVGNPEDLSGWLAGSCERQRRVFLPPDGPAADGDVTLDYVGSLDNAATVISRLHRGEKRLVFVDSRAKAEQLGNLLNQLEVTTFVTHSSLSQEQRQQAEEAFAARQDCVIVATSVLELGIDVGNLDRVIQIDSPTTVSSFLQRMGRTGRRADMLRNCLFLTTSDDAVLQAAGLIALWEEGYVEPIEPPPHPWHILAQQLMAIALQEGGIGRTDWFQWISQVPGFVKLPKARIRSLLDWMLSEGILWDDSGILWLGETGEKTFGRQNFIELFSVFTSPPMFAVRHGRAELGYVDETTFMQKQDGPRILLLGGRAWQLNHIDWQRRIAFVEPSEQRGRSRWKGSGRGLSFAMCQAIRNILANEEQNSRWSRRARERLTAVRESYDWVRPDQTTALMSGDSDATWWTFAGARANASLANALARHVHDSIKHDDFAVSLPGGRSAQALTDAINTVRTGSVEDYRPSIDEQAVSGLKFSECLPETLSTEMIQRRMIDREALMKTCEESLFLRHER